MISITTDTNILVSSTITKGNEFELLKLVKLGKVKLILSLEILKEFKDVISRPKFSYSKKFIKEIFTQILNICYITFPNIKLNIIKEDPDDNRILECALAGKVNYIISGDEHLLKLKQYKNIKIIKAKEFLELIN